MSHVKVSDLSPQAQRQAAQQIREQKRTHQTAKDTAGRVTKIKTPPIPQSSSLESLFDLLLRVYAPDLPKPESEYAFDAGQNRKWRFDRAWHTVNGCVVKLAIECEGGIQSGGRHVRPQGYEKDLEKYNLAAEHGWLLLRFSTEMLNKHPQDCMQMIVRVYQQRMKQDTKCQDQEKPKKR
jgi:hypothetical protein